MSVFGSTVNDPDSILDHGSSNLIGEITRVLYKEEEAHPFIKSLLTGTLNDFFRIAGHLERLKLKLEVECQQKGSSMTSNLQLKREIPPAQAHQRTRSS